MAHEHNGLYKLESQATSRHNKRSKLERSQKGSSAKKNMRAVVASFTTIANKACNQLPLEVLHARLGQPS